jgi:hypothetical protein
MKGVEKEHEAFREKHDKMVSDMNKQFSEYESTKAPALDQTMFTLTTEGKDLLNNTHSKLKRKEIDPSYMGMAKQSMSDATTELYNITSNIGNVLSEAQTQVDEGEANPIMQQWAIDQYKDNTNLKNNKPVWVQNESNGYTNIVLQKTDGQGKLVTGPGTTTSIKQLGNMNNLRFLPIDLDADMKDFKNSFEVVRDDEGVTYRPITEEATDIFIKEYMSDSNRVLALLTMYGDHKPYAEGDDISSMDASKAIKMTVDDNYQYQPDFTEDQIIAAKNILLERISRLGGEKEPIKPGDKDDKPTSAEETAYDNYFMGQGIVIGNETEIKKYESRTGNKVEHSIDKGGITIFNEDGTVKGFAEYQYNDDNTVNTKETLDGLYKYLWDQKPKAASKELDVGYDQVKKKGELVKETEGRTRKEYTPEVESIEGEEIEVTTRGNKTLKFNQIKALGTFPDQVAKKIFKSLGVTDGVSFDFKDDASDHFVVTTPAGEYKVPKVIINGSGSITTSVDDKGVKEALQEIIDDYYEDLAQEQPQEQPMDLTQTGAKYNVA